MPKKPPKDAERNDRRDALEVLRDECAHSHDDVGLRQCRTIPQGEEKDEQAEFVADTDADERKAKALLQRLGDILETWSEGFDSLGQVAPPASEWQRSRLIAARVLLDRCEWRTITETSTFLADGEEFTKPWPIDSTTSQRVVPNIRLAIAEVCLVLLSVRVVRRRSRRTPPDYLAWLGIARACERANGRRPSGAELAQRLPIPMHASTFSRSIGRTKEWKDYQAHGVRDRRRT